MNQIVKTDKMPQVTTHGFNEMMNTLVDTIESEEERQATDISLQQSMAVQITKAAQKAGANFFQIQTINFTRILIQIDKFRRMINQSSVLSSQDKPKQEVLEPDDQFGLNKFCKRILDNGGTLADAKEYMTMAYVRYVHGQSKNNKEAAKKLGCSEQWAMQLGNKYKTKEDL